MLVVLDLDEGAARETAGGHHGSRWHGGSGCVRRVERRPRERRVRRNRPENTGGLDILVNNAGVSHVGTIEQTPEEDFDRLYRVNVKGVYLCSRAAVPVMVRQGGGVILNMASIVSLIGVAERFAYSMSKGAVLTMTKSVAVDYVKPECALQLHLPGAHPYAVRRRFRLEELSGPRTGNAAAAFGISAHGTHGHAGRSGVPGVVSVLR